MDEFEPSKLRTIVVWTGYIAAVLGLTAAHWCLVYCTLKG